MPIQSFLNFLGPEVEEPEEEAFLLFSQSIPSQNLGFVDSQATVLEVSIGGRELTIHQSPTILTSNRGGGTTGAVVWKITPLFASWISSASNVLFQHGVLNSTSTVLELGCGISGMIGLSLGQIVESYVLTDQDYVMKLLNQNLEGNRQDSSAARKGRKSNTKSKRGTATVASTVSINNVVTKSLDWELDEVTPELTGSDSKPSFDAVIACDCIYNDALIQPLVQTCVDVCKLRIQDGGDTPTLCIVAQQLRSSEVFQDWLQAFHKVFHVWRLPDEKLIGELKSDSGFVVHVGILR